MYTLSYIGLHRQGRSSIVPPLRPLDRPDCCGFTFFFPSPFVLEHACRKSHQQAVPCGVRPTCQFKLSLSASRQRCQTTRVSESALPLPPALVFLLNAVLILDFFPSLSNPTSVTEAPFPLHSHSSSHQLPPSPPRHPILYPSSSSSRTHPPSTHQLTPSRPHIHTSETPALCPRSLKSMKSFSSSRMTHTTARQYSYCENTAGTQARSSSFSQERSSRLC